MEEPEEQREAPAAAWDGVERRAQPDQPSTGFVGRPPGRGRMDGRVREQLVVGVASSVGASAVVWTVQFLAAHVHLSWH
ncbi:hypothetical protein [Kitasatospora sp. NPDC017646]|uniref:hypothetical protein n=1 Tax=Kitasatospora sp. NPDC017646 TaxID=3364024 RepID=UPI0037ABCC62